MTNLANAEQIHRKEWEEYAHLFKSNTEIKSEITIEEFDVYNDASNMEIKTEVLIEAFDEANDATSVPTTNDKPSKRFYKQIYRKDWEEYPLFKGWLSSVPDDKYRALCTACNKELLAHRLTLLKHASTAKHLKKIHIAEEKRLLEKMLPESSTASKSIFKTDSNPGVNACLPEFVNLNGVTVTSDVQLNHNKGFLHEMQNLPYINTDASDDSNEIMSESSLSNLDLFYEKLLPESSANNKMNADILTCHTDILDSVLNDIATSPPQVSTRVTEYSRCNSVANLSITMYKLTSGKWICVAKSITDVIGRCNLFPKTELLFTNGFYKLHYDVASYYQQQNLKSYFPFIEVSFLIRDPKEMHHIPLMISPDGYTVNSVNQSLDF